MTEQVSEPDIEEVLELPDQEFKTTMINMLRALMDRGDTMQEQMGNVSRDLENAEKEPKINIRDPGTL